MHKMLIKLTISEKNKFKENRATIIPEELCGEIINNVENENENGDHSHVLEANCSKFGIYL